VELVRVSLAGEERAHQAQAEQARRDAVVWREQARQGRHEDLRAARGSWPLPRAPRCQAGRLGRRALAPGDGALAWWRTEPALQRLQYLLCLGSKKHLLTLLAAEQRMASYDNFSLSGARFGDLLLSLELPTCLQVGIRCATVNLTLQRLQSGQVAGPRPP
jgi:hypothetical protein